MFTLKINNQIRAFYHPLIMGILNVTDDSFYDGGTSTTEKEILTKADRIVSQGADIIDIGACSTRPNANFVSEKEEITRIE
ncbi:MAG: dihydropteroate synthase, partial [Paludibacteraceae bacterium]|nr:dihydropteroate synthase [Paludibacteraceae bacterium]